MKPTLLLLALLFAGCGPENNPPPFIVTSVASVKANEGQYRVVYNKWDYFYTDTLYTVGDTIK